MGDERLMRYEEKEIDGHTYRVTVFDTETGLKLAAKLVALFSEGGASALDGDLSKGISAVVEQLQSGRSDVVALVRELVRKVEIDGHKQEGDYHFNFWFAGRFKTLAQVVKFSLEVNFADFFGVLGDWSKRLLSVVWLRMLDAETLGKIDQITQSSPTNLVNVVNGGSGSSGSTGTD